MFIWLLKAKPTAFFYPPLKIDYNYFSVLLSWLFGFQDLCKIKGCHTDLFIVQLCTNYLFHRIKMREKSLSVPSYNVFQPFWSSRSSLRRVHPTHLEKARARERERSRRAILLTCLFPQALEIHVFGHGGRLSRMNFQDFKCRWIEWPLAKGCGFTDPDVLGLAECCLADCWWLLGHGAGDKQAASNTSIHLWEDSRGAPHFGPSPKSLQDSPSSLNTQFAPELRQH